MRLPIGEAPSIPAETPQRVLPGGAALRVLVVDDNPDAADMLGELLELAGQDVRRANSGEGALQVAHEFRPQLVLLDISMPDMDGHAVARGLRRDPALAGAYIVAVTGYSPHDVRVDRGGQGFDDRVTKPFENDVLLGLLARVQARLARS